MPTFCLSAIRLKTAATTAGQTAEPAAHYPARARPGMSLADGFFQPAPAQVPPDVLRHPQDRMGAIAQFPGRPKMFGPELIDRR